MATIFGKEACPYTQRAIDHHRTRGLAFEYVNVKQSRADLDRMLQANGGHRRVPTIVADDGKVTIGFGGS
jgi:glutaredoxin 3